MQFSFFALTTLIIVPSLLFSVVFRIMKVPLRLSITQPKLPLQIFVLGICFPILPYIFAYAFIRLFWDISMLTPIEYLLGINKEPSLALFTSSLNHWSLFFLLYYLFCLAAGLILCLLIRWIDRIEILFEYLGIIDEEKFAEIYSDKVLVGADIVTVDGSFIYSGTLKSGIPKLYFSQGSIILQNVLKIPMADGYFPLEELKAKMARDGKLTSESFLYEMIFPKNNISNVNLRLFTNPSKANIRFVS